MTVDPKDIRWDFYTNSSPQIEVRATHLPTGLSVSASGSGSRYWLQQHCLASLQKALAARAPN